MLRSDLRRLKNSSAETPPMHHPASFRTAIQRRDDKQRAGPENDVQRAKETPAPTSDNVCYVRLGPRFFPGFTQIVALPAF
jgi:hypothetical protein